MARTTRTASQNSLDWPALEDVLVRLGEALERPATLTIIGSAVCMNLGLPDRMTMDVDVWKKDSTFDLGDLKRACERIGITFDPKGFDEPESVYIQMVEPGIVQLGTYTETEPVLRTGRLEIRRPPIANVIASKMVRGEARDFDDSAFLVAKCAVDWEQIESAVASIKNVTARECAMENLTLLRLVLSPQPIPACRPSKSFRPSV